ncbi:sodium-dependent proline transporter-like [Ylistrum balloti]|uniref:sodium-dependent proline transporter-like n=1 Tax=Ylistrum balloti TaxID=509963 RepID=UPI002905823A|nr:sodium-dependent proline transporter-like [Ylistrum balloti]
MMSTRLQTMEAEGLVSESAKPVHVSPFDDEDTETAEGVKDTKRGQWAHKLDSLLSMIGYCVGYGNIWRFPYFCMRNGGGSFLVAFLFILVICGLPTFFLDLVMGQFSGKTTLHAWEICPLLQGIGAGALIVLFVISTYYNMIIAWTLFYLGSSFLTPLPWDNCDNSWNTANCIINKPLHNTSLYNYTTNTTELTESVYRNNVTLPKKVATSTEEFWRYRLLDISTGIDALGDIPWHLAVCLLAAWLLTFVSLIRGIRSSGKVVYVTALLPYFILTIIFIRTLLLPGAADGIIFFITPDMNKLSEAQVWLEAALQVFYSLGPGWGPLITIASYNDFHNNCFRDSILMVFICEGTSIYGGLVVFAVLGFMAHQTGMTISDVVTSGPGLTFMTYPEALTYFPLPNLWTVLFFVMMITVGMDSQLSTVESLISAVMDQFPALRPKRVLIQGIGCILWFLLGLILCTQGGMYVFLAIDWYVALSIPLFAFTECIIVGWIYGAERFSRDVELMLGRGIPVLVRISICFIAPSMLLVITICTLTTYKAPTYGAYQFPSYITIYGFFLGFLPLVPVVFRAITAICHTNGETIAKRIVNACKPSANWKPASRVHAKDYTYHDLSKYKSVYSRVKLNILGPRG